MLYEMRRMKNFSVNVITYTEGRVRIQ